MSQKTHSRDSNYNDKEKIKKYKEAIECDNFIFNEYTLDIEENKEYEE